MFPALEDTRSDNLPEWRGVRDKSREYRIKGAVHAAARARHRFIGDHLQSRVADEESERRTRARARGNSSLCFVTRDLRNDVVKGWSLRRGFITRDVGAGETFKEVRSGSCLLPLSLSLSLSRSLSRSQSTDRLMTQL